MTPIRGHHRTCRRLIGHGWTGVSAQPARHNHLLCSGYRDAVTSLSRSWDSRMLGVADMSCPCGRLDGLLHQYGCK
jgi:hypothetical protein